MAKDTSTLENMPRLPRQGGGGGHRARFKPVEKPKDAKVTLLRIVKLYLRWGKSIGLALVLTIVAAGVSLATPYYIGQAVKAMDIQTGTVSQSLLYTSLAALLGCYSIAWAVSSLNGWIMTRVSQRLVEHIRAEFFEKLQRLPLRFYDTRQKGDTMSRLTNDAENISSTVAQTTTQLISGLISVVGSLLMMLILSPVLTLAALVTLPLIFLLTRVISGRSRRYFAAQASLLGSLNGLIEESVTGMKMVKAFNRQAEVLDEFAQLNRRLTKNSASANMWSGFMMPFMNVINNLSFALLACAGGLLSVRGVIDVGVVVSFMSYSKQFSQPINNIAAMFTTIQSALAGAERVFEVLDQAEETPDRPDAIDPEQIGGEVEFRSVSFGYTPEQPVLNNISFTVKKGEVIALVGQTGAGKTTIVNLLTRFYEVNQGAIYIDGVDIRNIKRSSLRRYFSVVLQDTCLFSGTILDNIRYSNPKASDEEVVAAAKLAFADSFITQLPKGYHTKVSASSDTLSQGQRQLISIARAILCDARLLILDEATSSVDTKTEKTIQKAFLSLMRDKTSFLIAHRLSTIRDADRIMVIGEGSILESGTHQELMAAKGEYYRMVQSQMGLEEPA